MMRYLTILFLFLLTACDDPAPQPAESVDVSGDVTAVDAPDAVTVN